MLTMSVSDVATVLGLLGSVVAVYVTLASRLTRVESRLEALESSTNKLERDIVRRLEALELKLDNLTTQILKQR